MTPVQTRIFDAVRRGGRRGVDLQQIMGSERSRDCVKAHVWHLNQLLADVGLRIVGTRGGRHDQFHYALIKGDAFIRCVNKGTHLGRASKLNVESH